MGNVDKLNGKQPVVKTQQNTAATNPQQKPAEEKGFFGSIWGGISDVAEATWDGIGTGAKYVGNKIADGAEATWDGTKYVGNKIADGAEVAWDVVTFADENTVGALYDAQKEKGEATARRAAAQDGAAAGVGTHTESFVLELAGTPTDALAGTEKRIRKASNFAAKYTKATTLTGEKNSALKALDALSNTFELTADVSGMIEGTAKMGTGYITLEERKNRQLDEAHKQTAGRLADESVDFSKDNADDSKTIIKGEDRLKMAFSDEDLKKMTDEQKRTYLTGTMTPDQMKEIGVTLKPTALPEEVLIVLAKKEAAKYDATRVAKDLKTHHIEDGKVILKESANAARNSSSALLSTGNNILKGGSELVDMVPNIPTDAKKGEFSFARMVDGIVGKDGALGLVGSTLGVVGNAGNIATTSYDTNVTGDGKVGTTKHAADETLSNGKKFVNALTSVASLGLTNAFGWKPFEEKAPEAPAAPAKDQPAKANEGNAPAVAPVVPKKPEVATTARPNIEQKVEQARDNKIKDEVKAKMKEYKKMAQTAEDKKLAAEAKAEAKAFVKKQGLTGDAMLEAYADKYTEILKAKQAKMAEIKAKADELSAKANPEDARRQAALAAFAGTVYEKVMFEERNSGKNNTAGEITYTEGAKTIGKGFLKAIGNEALLNSNMAANTGVWIPICFIVAGSKMGAEGGREFIEAIKLYNNDEHNSALKHEALQKGVKALMKLCGGVAIGTIPVYDDCVCIFEGVCKAAKDSSVLKAVVDTPCDTLIGNPGALGGMLPL